MTTITASTCTRNIAARLTPAGRGAVAVIGLRGTWLGGLQELPFQSAAPRDLSVMPLRRMCYGRWGRNAAEEVVLCRVDDTVCEIQCHGGVAAVERILHDLQQLGYQTVSAEEFAQQRRDRWSAEFDHLLAAALTVRTASFLVEQQQRGFVAAARRWEALAASPGERDQVTEEIATALSWAKFGGHLTTPWSVVLTGRPNVGKSSLINALLGFERALVSPLPGTTRDVVQAVTALEGWPVQLADTAGIRATAEGLERDGIVLAEEQLAAADLVLVVLDGSAPLTAADLTILQQHPHAVVVCNKADLPRDPWHSFPKAALAVSSINGTGLIELQTAIVQRLVPQIPAEGTAYPCSPTQTEWLQAFADRQMCPPL
jgi:tRNA modification GTPase